jgi:hypothetical protein
VFTTLHLPGVTVGASLAQAGPAYREVSVAGAWGYADVPAMVREACNMTVGYVLRTMSQGQGDEIDGPVTGWAGSGVLIPGNAKRLLAPFRQYALGA